MTSNATPTQCLQFVRLLRRAAAKLLLTAGTPSVQQSIDISWPPGPQQQTRRRGVQRPDKTDRQTDREADGRMPESWMDPAPHTIRALTSGERVET